MKNSVSVLLPVYNAERTLARAVRSLQVQSLRDFEIVVVDDGSTDKTQNVIRQLKETDGRLRYIRTEHRGVVSALTIGLQEGRGDYVARMDADDICLPTRLELQKEYLDRNPQVGLVASPVIFGGDPIGCKGYARYVDWSNSLTDSRAISLHRFVESPVVHPSVMFRRRIVDQLGGYRDGDFPEDYELWLRWLDGRVRMDKVNEPLLIWNDTPERLSRKDSRYAIGQFYQTKSRYLYRWLSIFNPFHPEVWVIGAGRTARRRARLLEDLGVRIAAYVDVDPRKVGHTINGRPVVERSRIPSPGACFLLSYVGSRGAREDIQSFLESRGHRLGSDFLLAA